MYVADHWQEYGGHADTSPYPGVKPPLTNLATLCPFVKFNEKVQGMPKVYS